MILGNLLNLSLNVYKTPINNIAYPLEVLVVMIMYDDACKMVSMVSGERSSTNLNCCSYCYTASSQSGPEPEHAAELKLFLQAANS